MRIGRKKKSRRKVFIEYFDTMETPEKNDHTHLPTDGFSQPGVAKPWVKNLLAAQGFALPESVQFWWSVHLEAFLRYARKRGPGVPLEQLETDYLTGLRMEQPIVAAVFSEALGMNSWPSVCIRGPHARDLRLRSERLRPHMTQMIADPLARSTSSGPRAKSRGWRSRPLAGSLALTEQRPSEA